MLDDWLLKRIRDGNGEAHPLFDYQADTFNSFKGTQEAIAKIVEGLARGDDLIWLERIIAEMPELFV